MEAILRDENLEHLLPSLARRDVRELQSLLAANRVVAFLAELKAPASQSTANIRSWRTRSAER